MFYSFIRRALPGTLAVLGLASVAAAPAQADSTWSQDGHDAARTWRNTEEAAVTLRRFAQLRPLAQVEQGQFYVGASSMGAAGTQYNCNNLSRLTATDAVTGSARWSRPDLEGGECGNVAVSERSVFVSTLRRFDYWGGQYELGAYLFALDPASGQTQWQAKVEDPYSLGLENPTLAGGRVFVTDGRSAVYAFDAQSGARLWAADTGGRLNNAATAGLGKVFVSTWLDCCETNDRLVMAFDARSGAPVWQYSLGQDNSWHAPMLMGRLLVATTSNGRVVALNADTGALVWTRQLAGYIPEPPAAGGDTVYLTQQSGIVALDAATGAVRWQRSMAGYSLASNLVVLPDGVALVALDGVSTLRLAMLGGRAGNLVRAPNLTMYGTHAQLTVAQGRVQVATNQGELHLFGLPAKP